MSRISREINRALHSLESDLDNPTIQWNSQTLVCIPKTSVDDLSLSLGGAVPSSDATFLIADYQFKIGTRRPVAKEIVFKDGVRYWISNVNKSSDGSTIRIDCNLPESRA